MSSTVFPAKLSSSDVAVVITSIYGVTPSVRQFLEQGFPVIMVCDEKTPIIQNEPGLTVLTLDKQEELGFSLAELTRRNHYCRKNLGYLYAIREGYQYILDSDDDTHLLDIAVLSAGGLSERSVGGKFANCFSYFSHSLTWPRGFPLNRLKEDTARPLDNQLPIGVWQVLVSGEPDIDAIQRLSLPAPEFFSAPSLGIESGCFSPFNSQCTLWSKEAFPYLYLPQWVSFRATDIWRGYIASRCLWQHNLHVGFLSPTAFQERNPHNFLHDFAQEVDCYLRAEELADTLLSQEPNLQDIYAAGRAKRFFEDQEMSSVAAWQADLNRVLE